MDLFFSIEQRVTQHILAQFEDPICQQELVNLGPAGVNWSTRTRRRLDVLLPRLPALAQYLVEAVPRRLNSPLRILSGMQDAASEVEKIP